MRKDVAQVKILVKGYARTTKKGEFASSSCVLIKEKNVKIIVDPGMDRKSLLKALRKEKLNVNKIDYVILTHTHPDHVLLTGIFEKAKILDDTSIYSFEGKISSHDGKVPGTEIKIIKTPGHDPFHCAVLAKTKKGNVVIAGDVFWWWSEEKQKTDRKSLMSKKDPYEKDHKKLLQSRKKLLEIADYIIPGHGKMFRSES